MPVCSLCRRRPAFYYREYGGHALCPVCLERMIEKAVKRTLNEAGVLEPSTRVLVPIYRFDPWGGLAAARIVGRIEAQYNVEVLVAAPAEYRDVLEGALPGRLVAEEAPRPRRDTLVHCIRLERSWALEAARREGAAAIIDSLNRTHLLLSALEALLDGRSEALSDALPAMTWTRPPVIHAFSRVEAETVTAHAHARGYTSLLSPSCRAAALSKRIYSSIAGRRPELAFSMEKTVPRLAEAARSEACVFCGGFGGPVCSYCRENMPTG